MFIVSGISLDVDRCWRNFTATLGICPNDRNTGIFQIDIFLFLLLPFRVEEAIETIRI